MVPGLSAMCGRKRTCKARSNKSFTMAEALEYLVTIGKVRHAFRDWRRRA